MHSCLLPILIEATIFKVLQQVFDVVDRVMSIREDDQFLGNSDVLEVQLHRLLIDVLVISKDHSSRRCLIVKQTMSLQKFEEIEEVLVVF